MLLRFSICHKMTDCLPAWQSRSLEVMMDDLLNIQTGAVQGKEGEPLDP